MYKQKTLPSQAPVVDFIETIADERQKREASVLLNLIHDTTGLSPCMWGGSIIGFGSYSYTYASGHRGTSFLFGFSPRRNSFSIYTATGSDGTAELLKHLGRHRMGKACLSVNRLSDINLDVLKDIILNSVQFLRNTYPVSS